jgi:lactate 2-monooxygenase
MNSFGDFEDDIYGTGLLDVLPTLPMEYAHLEARAQESLPASVVS